MNKRLRGNRLYFTQKVTKKPTTNSRRPTEEAPMSKKNNQLGKSTKTSIYLHQFTTPTALCGDMICLRCYVLWVLLRNTELRELVCFRATRLALFLGRDSSRERHCLHNPERCPGQGSRTLHCWQPKQEQSKPEMSMRQCGTISTVMQLLYI